MTTRIYFDNAATTALDPEVLNAMMPYFTEKYGNPSSIYSYGRESRMAVESARKSVAKILNARPAEIFFTSCGTESNNTIITAAVRDLKCTRIITSHIEHHAVTHTVEYLDKLGGVKVQYVNILPNGHVDINHLESLLSASDETTLVSLMHANNEIGNMIDLQEVGAICKKHNAYFHSDTVQTVGHFPFDLRNTPVDFITASAHKFHGPKGCGMLYVNENIRIQPFIHGGSQERNMRAGTENVYGIVGFAKALEMTHENFDTESNYIRSVKYYMYDLLNKHFPEAGFNGDPLGRSNYTVLSVSFPKNDKTNMLLFNLDIKNICVSSGSACSSGANTGSHVIHSIHPEDDQVTIRFSFCKYNTKEEVDTVVSTLTELLHN